MATELKHSIRKVEFPQVILEAFRQIEQLWIRMDHSEALRYCPKLVYEIIEEFIFQEVDRRGNPRRKLTPVRELQVLNNIHNYFMQIQANDVKANNLFLVLFPPYHFHELRLPLLCRLLSMAIVLQNTSILTCGGVWMQLSGCDSSNSVKIAQTIVNDYFKLVPATMSYLTDLPRTSSVFCASLIAAISSWFSSAPILPEVVKVVHKWVTTTPLLCFAPLHIATIPSAIRLQMPLLGLLLWTVLAPLRNAKDGDEVEDLKLANVYSGLHLAILDTMIKVTQMKVSHPNVEILTSRDVISIIDSLQELISRTGVENPQVEVATNRLGQAIQVALATGCLKGDLSEMFSKLAAIPGNRLLSIVAKCH